MNEIKRDKFTIRNAVQSDTPIILEFIKKIAQYEKMSDDVVNNIELLENYLWKEKLIYCLIAEYDSTPIGFALYFYNYSTFVGRAGLYLEDLFIDKEFRGYGFGKQIFLQLVKTAKEKNCQRMEWTCLNWNESSIKFYKSLGAFGMSEWTTYRLTGENMAKIL